MHTEPLTDIDRTLLRQRAGFRGRLFYWVGIIVGLALLAFTAFIVLPPIIQGYEFRDLDVLAEAWVVAATMFAVCYLIIGLFERRATSSVREDVIDNIKEVHTGKVISIEEKTELEPTELHLLEDANAERFKIHLRTIRELNLLTDPLRAHVANGGIVRVEIAPHSQVVLTLAPVSQ